ncbi:YceI family protein [Dokdonella sp.]|uniref:YceI family protein n=1 Tax=Dokdonella sp. TaxID=2291710 RepID=UPI0031C317A6|nr:YceI family protein [Dokdonella sp.]
MWRGWLVTLLACAAATSACASEVVALDGARSSAEFSVRVMWLMRAHGGFSAIHGTVAIDRFNSHGVVDAIIDADSVCMNVPSYEAWVKSPEFFDVAAHPRIQFISQAFPLQRLRTGGELVGTLKLRGVSRPIRFRLAPSTCTEPGYACAILAEGSLSRAAFGMHSRRGTVGDKVRLELRIFTDAPLLTDRP